MKNLFKTTLFLTALLISFSCSWKWEPLTSDYDPVLNVYGVISLDPEIPSFVYVTRTLTLQDSSQKVFNRDTIWYSENEYWLYETYRSNFLVTDADVTISDGNQQYRFSPVRLSYDSHWIDDSTYIYDSPEIPLWFNGSESYVYLDTSGAFQPQPGSEYSITVQTDAYPQLTGTVFTPDIPLIFNWESLPDTLKTGTGYTLRWKAMNPGQYGVLQYQSGNWGDNIRRFIEAGDSLITFIPELGESNYEPGEDEKYNTFTLTLRFMERNYYDFFVKGQDDEVFSFLLGASNKQLAYGVEGGNGAFTAFSQITLRKPLK
jgi:hypothetical protein